MWTQGAKPAPRKAVRQLHCQGCFLRFLSSCREGAVLIRLPQPRDPDGGHRDRDSGGQLGGSLRCELRLWADALTAGTGGCISLAARAVDGCVGNLPIATYVVRYHSH